MVGLSTIGSISFGIALVAGRNLVPSPAAGMIAFLTFIAIPRFSTIMMEPLVPALPEYGRQLLDVRHNVIGHIQQPRLQLRLIHVREVRN